MAFDAVPLRLDDLGQGDRIISVGLQADALLDGEVAGEVLRGMMSGPTC